MAQDVTSGISHYLAIKAARESDLAAIRKWKNLKVATDKDVIWISNFEDVQIASVEVKSIPEKQIYYSKNGKIYPQNSLLPAGNEPSFLWTPIERAFPIELTHYNHNFFGINEKIAVSIVESEYPKDAAAMMVDLNQFDAYIQTTPAIRLKNLTWVILNYTEVFVFGTPLLPLNGKVYWKRQNHFLPIGYDFELYELSDMIDQKVDPERLNWIIWDKESTYFLIEKSMVQPLTIGSFRKSMQPTENNAVIADYEG